ncbi:hypothetical protein HYQ46_008329 [Verticillium longisporum]|nr:hypothetical protein HYQ46_008329 [Verticillium longisporum]
MSLAAVLPVSQEEARPPRPGLSARVRQAVWRVRGWLTFVSLGLELSPIHRLEFSSRPCACIMVKAWRQAVTNRSPLMRYIWGIQRVMRSIWRAVCYLSLIVDIPTSARVNLAPSSLSQCRMATMAAWYSTETLALGANGGGLSHACFSPSTTLEVTVTPASRRLSANLRPSVRSMSISQRQRCTGGSRSMYSSGMSPGLRRGSSQLS